MNIQKFLNTPMSEIRPERELKHYASEYYDPVKAHEYYEQHKKLKGRQSSGNNDESSNDSSSTSDSKSNSTSNSTSSSSGGSYEEEYEKYQFETNKKIQTLQRRLGRLSKEARMLLQDEIYSEIDKLREENMNKRRELKQKYGKGSGSGSSGSANLSAKTSEAYKAKWG